MAGLLRHSQALLVLPAEQGFPHVEGPVRTIALVAEVNPPALGGWDVADTGVGICGTRKGEFGDCDWCGPDGVWSPERGHDVIPTQIDRWAFLVLWIGRKGDKGSILH